MIRADIPELIAVATGKMQPETVLANARIVNVFNGTIETGNVAIQSGYIAGIGDYRKATRIIDLQGQYLLPGFINGHTHIESSYLDIGPYAAAVVPDGTLGVISDLHEIANVAGLTGVRYMLENARRYPFEFLAMAPSCVPATSFETSGSSMSAAEISKMLRWRNVIGLGEMMNYPGVLSRDAQVLEKISHAGVSPIDGHAPSVRGHNLNAYIAAGIDSDHECVKLSEAREKLARGMYIMMREGSTEKNLEELLPIVTGKTSRRCLLVVDDRSCTDLKSEGDVAAVVRKAIRLGLSPITAIQMASINVAERFRLRRIGAIAPGYLANVITTTKLSDMKIASVFHHGNLVAQNGRPLFEIQRRECQSLEHSVRIKSCAAGDLRIQAPSGNFHVIELVPGQIVTRKSEAFLHSSDGGYVQSDTSADILKLAVFERHHATGNIGKGFVKGFGLKAGAMASSIAHDSHNIITVGTNDEDMALAVQEIVRLQGGLVITRHGQIIKTLPLPVAGLLSDRPLDEVVDAAAEIDRIAREAGVEIPSPFALLSFLGLPVIPQLRLTDRGLFDVTQFKFTALATGS